MDINATIDQYLAAAKKFWTKTVVYFSKLPQGDPLELYSWVAIALGLVLVIVALAFL